MKTNTPLFILLFCFSITPIFGQLTEMPSFECIEKPGHFNLQDEHKGSTVDKSSALTCTENEIKYIRVNFHFMLKEDPENPENFTETGDGLGSDCITGYDYAERIIKNANDNWQKNFQPVLYPGDQVPEWLPKRVQLVLKNIYFHRDDEAYDDLGQSSIGSVYAQNTDEVVNIFSMEVPSNTSTGGLVANGLPAPVIHMRNVWNVYNAFPCNFNAYLFGRVINHELGHLFGLCHVYYCDNPCADIDIDLAAECNDGGGCGFSCGASDCFNWVSGSNNSMGNNELAHALTPCQLDIIHTTIDSDWGDYIEYCCPDWEIESITCCGGNLSGIKMLPSCQLVGVSDDEVSQIKQRIKVFPNPASDHLVLNCSEIEVKQIEILDINNRMVKVCSSLQTQSQNIDVSSLPQGIYLVKIMTIGRVNPLLIKFLKI